MRAQEVSSIVQSVMEREVTDLILNSPRRFLFNPSANLTRKQKMKIVNRENGKVRTEKTKEEIAKCIDEWDVTTQGSISQNKLKYATGKSIGTIEKYYKFFKSEIADIKERYNQLKTG